MNEPIVSIGWAMTMLRTGGTALLPIHTGSQDPYQADRSIVLWPYTKLHELEIHEKVITMAAERTEPTKVGTALGRGWLAYLWEDQVFVKRAQHHPDRAYPDLGASGQVYCNAGFCELETLGPSTELAPGASVSHREVWELHDRAALPSEPAELVQALDREPEA